MDKLYRKDYQGEFVVHVTTKVRGQVVQERDWIPNTIVEKHTGHALVIGNGVSRLDYSQYNHLFLAHRGGLHATKKLTTYGCNAVYRDFAPHMLVVNHPFIASEVVESGYADDHIVLTHAKNILKYPNKFHLIPFDPYLDAGATALYLAAFDLHNHVYFMGFDGQDSPNINNNVYAGTFGYAAKTAEVSSTKWAENAALVFNTYNNVEFIRVVSGGGETMPEQWKYCPNVRQISWRQFVSEVDLGAT